MKIYCFRCKGTTKNANTQIFLEKNAFLDEKSAHGLHFTRFFAYHSVTTCHFLPFSCNRFYFINLNDFL